MKPIRCYLLFFVLVSFTLSGCYRYVTVRMTDHEKYTSEPDIVKGRSFHDSLDNTKSIVIQLPDTCYESTSRSISSGKAVQSNVVLATYCSDWVTGVEKELIRKGFNVKSSLELAITLKQGKRTLVEAAREIGADTVLQINALEFPELKPNSKSLKFYKSNLYGDEMEPVQMEKFYIDKIVTFIERELSGPQSSEKTGFVKAGLLDCKVIDVQSQNSVYYFNHKIKRKGEEGKYLYKYKNYQIWAIKPLAKGSSTCLLPFMPQPRASEATLYSDQTVNPVEKQKKELAEKLSKEFVKHFSQDLSASH